MLPLAGAICLRMFGLFVMLPVIAPHVVAHPAGTVQLAGLAVGVYGLAQAIMLAPLGWLSDRVGRKAVMLGGLALFAAGGFLGGSIDHPVVIILGRLMQGLGAVSSVVMASIADVTSPQSRAQGMALVGVGIGVSFGLALVLAGPLVAVLGVPGMLQLTGWLGLAALVVIAFTKVAGVPAETGVLAKMVDVRLLPLCLGVFGLHSCMAALFVVLPLRMVELIALEQLWQVYLVAFLLAAALAAPLIVWHSRNWRLLAGSAVLVAGAVLGLLLAGQASLWACGVLLTVFFVGFNYLEAVLPVRASLLALPGARGATMGMYALAQAIGVFVGGWAAGWAGG